MTKVVNPINRTNDEMESKACGCKCVCNENIAPHGVGQAGAWVPLIPGCGCICSSNTDNKNANSNVIMLSRAKKGMLRGGVSFPF